MPAGQPPLDLFVGREAEVSRVAEIVARVEAGQPWLVAIEGDPGMGKTALARRCLTGSAGLRVLSARADQVEADLDFGVVGQLLRSAGGAFGMAGPGGGADPPGSSFAMGARLLEMLGELQGGAAVAVLIDDVQWADRKSVEALTFMFRRLSVDPVIAVVVYRGPADRLEEAARRLLRSIENRLLIRLEGLDPREALAELGHLDADPARVALADVDGLSFRGVFRLLAGDLSQAVRDLVSPPSLHRGDGAPEIATPRRGHWRDALGQLMLVRGSSSRPASTTRFGCWWRPELLRGTDVRPPRPCGDLAVASGPRSLAAGPGTAFPGGGGEDHGRTAETRAPRRGAGILEIRIPEPKQEPAKKVPISKS